MQKKIKIMSLFLLLLFCNLSLVKSTTIPSSYSTIEKDYLSMQVVDTESPATMKRKYSVCRYCGEILHREKYDIAKEKTRPKQMEMEN